MIKQFMNRQRIADHKAADQTGLERESQKGASAIEYVMIIAVIVVVIAGAFVAFGPDVDGVFERMSSFFEE